jgi:isoquinoline 1-oxidoreductase beta subunit
MTGGVGFALSAALGEKITLKNGQVEQSNFHDYTPLRMGQMPVVEVYILPSQEAPSGVGEPGVPPLAPAVANALFAATGKRHYELPLGTKA